MIHCLLLLILDYFECKKFYLCVIVKEVNLGRPCPILTLVPSAIADVVTDGFQTVFDCIAVDNTGVRTVREQHTSASRHCGTFVSGKRTFTK